jgi:hypothetical protein
MLPAIWLIMIAATAIIWLSSLSSSVMSAPTFITASAAAASWITPITCKFSGSSIVCTCGFRLGSGIGATSEGSGVGSKVGSKVGSGIGVTLGSIGGSDA